MPSQLRFYQPSQGLTRGAQYPGKAPKRRPCCVAPRTRALKSAALSSRVVALIKTGRRHDYSPPRQSRTVGPKATLHHPNHALAISQHQTSSKFPRDLGICFTFKARIFRAASLFEPPCLLLSTRATLDWTNLPYTRIPYTKGQTSHSLATSESVCQQGLGRFRHPVAEPPS